ncbi:hypothetical protein [Nostoc sp. DedQUE09]|uniref:hypothetical protein n=1 Tax=Nostoc sp. DedQUE09 TaxID=3075394 RepID=UPI002AD3464D|nr:hypothetical protein [Nostoc sp. DedQUE09]MDZ7953353.1 hypothetical protein [Nostoc sp. DedQUE09]MDZ7953381.1 hypothetical protein [Nostoc sp. DedQUE09]
MQIKTISYKRVINLGNYENKHLELFAEVEEGEDVETAISSLAELVERKIREETEKEIKLEILRLQETEANLIDQISDLKPQLKALKYQLEYTGNEPIQPSPTFGILPVSAEEADDF